MKSEAVEETAEDWNEWEALLKEEAQAVLDNVVVVVEPSS